MGTLDSHFFEVAEERVRPLPLADGSTVDFPLRSYESRMMALTVTIAADRAAAILPPQFVPVRLTPRRALLLLVAVEYTRKCIGPYREVFVAIPVTRGVRWGPPLLPALLETRWPGFGLYLTHIAVTTERARAIGWEILGFPKFLADIAFADDDRRRSCTVREHAAPVLSFSVTKGQAARARRGTMHVYSLSPADNFVYHVVYENQMTAHVSFGRHAGALHLAADHPMAAELRALQPGDAPVQGRSAASFQLISNPPQERIRVGAWRDPRYLYRRSDPGEAAAVTLSWP